MFNNMSWKSSGSKGKRKLNVGKTDSGGRYVKIKIDPRRVIWAYQFLHFVKYLEEPSLQTSLPRLLEYLEKALNNAGWNKVPSCGINSKSIKIESLMRRNLGSSSIPGWQCDGQPDIPPFVLSHAGDLGAMMNLLKQLDKSVWMEGLSKSVWMSTNEVELLGLTVFWTLKAAVDRCDPKQAECERKIKDLIEWRRNLTTFLADGWEEVHECSEIKIASCYAEGDLDQVFFAGLKSKRSGYILPSLNIVKTTPPVFLNYWESGKAVEKLKAIGVDEAVVTKLKVLSHLLGKIWGDSDTDHKSDSSKNVSILEFWAEVLSEERSRYLRKYLEKGILTIGVIEAWHRFWQQATEGAGPSARIVAWLENPECYEEDSPGLGQSKKIITHEWFVPNESYKQSQWICPPATVCGQKSVSFDKWDTEVAKPVLCTSIWKLPIIEIAWNLDPLTLVKKQDEFEKLLKVAGDIHQEASEIGNRQCSDDFKRRVIRQYWTPLVELGGVLFEYDSHQEAEKRWLKMVSRALAQTGLNLYNRWEGHSDWFPVNHESSDRGYRPAVQDSTSRDLMAMGAIPHPNRQKKLSKKVEVPGLVSELPKPKQEQANRLPKVDDSPEANMEPETDELQLKKTYRQETSSVDDIERSQDNTASHPWPDRRKSSTVDSCLQQSTSRMESESVRDNPKINIWQKPINIIADKLERQRRTDISGDFEGLKVKVEALRVKANDIFREVIAIESFERYPESLDRLGKMVADDYYKPLIDLGKAVYGKTILSKDSRELFEALECVLKTVKLEQVMPGLPATERYFRKDQDPKKFSPAVVKPNDSFLVDGYAPCNVIKNGMSDMSDGREA